VEVWQTGEHRASDLPVTRALVDLGEEEKEEEQEEEVQEEKEEREFECGGRL